MFRYAIVYVPVGSKTIDRIAKDSLRFSSLGTYDGKDRCPKFEYAVHEGDGAVVRRAIWVVFFGLYMSLVALVHHCFCV